MATYVLVHGATAGGWIWAPVPEMLRRQGHAAYTPTLTGLGERSHLLRPDIDLDTHITDIVNVFKFEDLTISFWSVTVTAAPLLPAWRKGCPSVSGG